MVRKKSDKLYVLKTAPNREKTVVDLINRYYICKEGEDYGQEVVLETELDLEKTAKKGFVRKVRIPKKEREELRKKKQEELAIQSGKAVEEVNVPLETIPKYREKVAGKSALGFFNVKLFRKVINIDRRVCLVDEVVVPQLRGYVVVATKDRKTAVNLKRRIRFAWKVLDGTVSRREIDMNIKELEERTRIDIGDIVIPQAGSVKGTKSEVIGVTFDGRYRLKTIEGSVPIEFTISKDKLVKKGADE